MKLKIICLLLLLSCFSEQAFAKDFEPDRIYEDTNVMEIIRQAAEAAPDGVKGEYTLKIKAAGKSQNALYLNTEIDYRDPRNVSVAIHPRAFKAFRKKYGKEAQDFFVGKKIKIQGEARRVIIKVSPEGKPPYKYYYFQTHIHVFKSSHISLIDEQA